MIIYKVTNKINGKMYIGQTVNELSIRKAGHLYEARRDNTNIVFHNAIKKYGKNNFKWEIITTADSMNKLNILETYFINKYHTFLDDIKCNGYNMTTGGDNSLLSNDAKQKISETRKRLKLSQGENNPMFGKHHSNCTKIKMSKKRLLAIERGEWKNPSTCLTLEQNRQRILNISISLKGMESWNSGIIGKKSHCWKDIDLEKLKIMIEQGMTKKNIAKYFEVSESAISRRRKNL